MLLLHVFRWLASQRRLYLTVSSISHWETPMLRCQILMVSLLVLVACGTTATPMPTVVPTYTPYPTYTPVPTQRPLVRLVVVTATPIPAWLVTPLPTRKPQPTYTPLPTYTPQPTYTPVPVLPTPTSTPVIAPATIWGRAEISDIYRMLKEDSDAALNTYIGQRIRVQGPASIAENDSVVVAWPEVGARPTRRVVFCRLLNPSEELMDRVNNIQRDSIVDIEGDIYELDLREGNSGGRFHVWLSNCVIYLRTYRTPSN